MTFEEYIASLGFRLMDDGRFMAPDGESFYDADQMHQVLDADYQAVAAAATPPAPVTPTVVGQQGYQTLHGPVDELGQGAKYDADPMIDGVQYRSIPGDPESVARLKGMGLDVQNHPEYGWIAPDDAKYAAAFPERNSDSIFDFGPFILGGGLAALAAGAGGLGAAGLADAGASASLPESYWSATAGLDTGTAASVGGGAATTPAALPAITPEYIASGIGPSTTLTSGFTGGAGLSLADLARIPTPPPFDSGSAPFIPQGVKDAAGVAGGAATLASLADQPSPAPLPAIDDAYVNQAIGPNTVLSGTTSPSALDTLGLQQMAAAAGLTGNAAQVFADNGGMASTAPLADLPGYAPPAPAPAPIVAPTPTIPITPSIGRQQEVDGSAQSIYDANANAGTEGYDPSLVSGVTGVGVNPGTITGAPEAKTALGKLLSGVPLNEDELGKLLGTIGSTALGIAGGMDQANAIREANDKNAAAFAAAQQRAMATLTEAQKQALQSSGAGRDEAIKAYKASLAEAVRYNEQALKSGVSGFESGRDASIKASTDALARGLGYNEQALGKSLGELQTTRDQSLAMSNAAKDEGMGILQAAQSGALDANRGTEDRYFGIGAPARERLEASYRPGFSMSNEPGYKDAIDQVMNSYLRKASVGGNPFENPGVSMEANKYVTAGTALPQLNTYRSQNAASGNVGLDTAGSAGLQRPGIYSSLGQLQSNLSSDFGKFDANLNTTAGTNMANIQSRAGEFGTNLISDTGRSVAGATERAGTNIGNANLTAGQYNTGLIDRSGSNVANANLTTGQNDSNLIGNIGRAGAGVLGQTFNSVPAPNSGAYNAAGSGLANLTNPQTDYSAVMAQILKQFQLANGRAY